MADGHGLGTLRTSRLVRKSEINERRSGSRGGGGQNSQGNFAARARDIAEGFFNSVKQRVPQDLDWRKPVRDYPVATSLGALGVGFLVAYSLGASAKRKGRRFSDGGSKKAGVLDQMKQTQMFGKLQHEVSQIGDKVVEELSQFAHQVAIPVVNKRVAELFETKAEKSSV